MTTGEYIISGLLIVANVIYALLYGRAEAYQKKKGENLATKEDIGAITYEVEQVKQGFNKFQHEYETKFSSLHERRTQVIEKLYKKVKRLHYASSVLTQYFKPVVEDFKKEE